MIDVERKLPTWSTISRERKNRGYGKVTNETKSKAASNAHVLTISVQKTAHSSPLSSHPCIDISPTPPNRSQPRRPHHLPNHCTNPPNPTVTPKCHAVPHAIANRYLGLNTVQINRCVRSAVQLAITLASVTPVKSVSSATWSPHNALLSTSCAGGVSGFACLCRNACSCWTQLLVGLFSCSVFLALFLAEAHFSLLRSSMPASDQYAGPAQLERKTRSPTARML